MNREKYYEMIGGDGTLDYEIYLNTHSLLSCQKPYDALANHDELQFQIVHQVEELWMKLMAFTLLEIDDYMAERQSNRVLTLFRRVHLLQQHLISQIALLETMSPKEYQEIRLQLGNGSGQESPGFRTLLKMAPELWDTFERVYLTGDGKSVDDIYDGGYDHGDGFMVAEAMADFDELFQRFRYHHIQLIHRSIGLDAKSLKGRPVEILQNGLKSQFYPALWSVRGRMTDNWGASYGREREALGATSDGSGIKAH
ncbi:tryptophan 2,3-dioxygenase family protein [Aquisalinus flavus]|uniref:Tryptophan 2,3-dioxygenase n=1 Tax=Aquisalinus flavus TaxID=1526572 RepID=A0A8J2V281_9PROT|nr:tryptophan 2,3-dioxygenase family protein [Aquisalinus flavus]MBD0425354.1 tryptophan 2,3-dioxygenase [Aquisalinus flavus]UNE48996.1 tryptophan 2,3-dioxygenase [Aquisalinus flavus]GGD16759.1 tryptophan 2,3-dioxygenase [Aquisalinus flavus]